MNKLKAAVLEDSKVLLKDLIYELVRIDLLQVVTYATGSEEFLKKVAAQPPDVLLLDIDLNGDAMNGLDIAAKLRLPVLFITGKMRDNIEGYSVINAELKEVPVEFITKPVTADKLNAILPKFIVQVRAMSKPKEVMLNLKDEGRKPIKLDSIVCLCSEKDSGAASGNKEIHFIDRKPAILVDFSFSTMEEKGLPREQFLTIHKSYRVNATHINGLHGDTITVRVTNEHGKPEEKSLPISENYLPGIRKQFC